MIRGTYPGIYLREEESAVRTIIGVPTSIAAFVGPTKIGIDARAQRVLNFGDFERKFGGLWATSELSYGVLHFFQNGGGEAFVVRVAGAEKKFAGIKAGNGADADALELTALSSGAAGNKIAVEVESTGGSDARTFSLSVQDPNTGVQESFAGLSTSPSSRRFAPLIVNDPDLGSQLVSVKVKAGTNVAAPVPTGTTFNAATPPDPDPFAEDVEAEKDYRFIVSITGFVEGTATKLLEEADVPLFTKGAVLPKSWSDFGKRVADKINGKLASAASKVRVESTFLEFRDEVTGAVSVRQLRFRVRSADPRSGEHVDALIEVKAAGTTADENVLKLFGLTPSRTNASRIVLGADYPTGTTSASGGSPGKDGKALTADDFDAGFAALDKVTFNLLCVPDAVPDVSGDKPEPNDVYAAAATLCEKRRAFLLIDPPAEINSVAKAEAWKTNGLQVRTPHAAAYFPRLSKTDPLNPGVMRAYPPSGSMAGVIARTDTNRGVWKSPAGVDATIAGIHAPAVLMSDDEHGILNPIGVNCVRKFPIYGSVSFGARTLVGSDAEADQWKYLAVRRTASFILLSLERGLTWTVFMGNDEPLWSQIRMNVTTFMQGLFRQGAFQGRSPREAYLVKCDAETTRPADVAAGIVNVVVGFAPLRPCEFVFVTLRQLVGQAQA